MPVLWYREDYAHGFRHVARESDAPLNLTRTFKCKVDKLHNDGRHLREIREARPDLYVWQRHPLLGAWVVEVHVDKLPGPGTIFKVSVEYSSEFGDRRDPPEQPPTVSLSGSQSLQAVLRDATGKPLLNTAGSPITGLEQQGGHDVIEITKYFRSVPDWWPEYPLGCVNEDRCRVRNVPGSYEPYELMLVDKRATPVTREENQPTIYECSFQLAASRVEGKFGGWYSRPLNMGLYELEDAYKEFLWRFTPGGREVWAVSQPPFGPGESASTHTVAIVKERSFPARLIEIRGDDDEPISEPVFLDQWGKRPRVATFAATLNGQSYAAGQTVAGPLTAQMKEWTKVKHPLDPIEDVLVLQRQLQPSRPFKRHIPGVS